MANQKAELHNINLKTSEVNLNKYKSDIKPYSGFRKNNSPFYGNVLSPFYGRTFPAIGTNSYVDKEGTIYSIRNGRLVIQRDDQESYLNSSTDLRFITKDTKEVSGNEIYSNILAFFHKPDDTYEMLCVSNEGKYAIIREDGTERYAWPTAAYSRYFPNEKVSFAMYNSYDDTYCFSVGNIVFFITPAGRLTYFSYYGSLDRTTAIINFGCIIRSHKFIVCFNFGNNPTMSQIIVPHYNDEEEYWTRIESLDIIMNGTTYTHTGVSHNFYMFFNGSGNAIFTTRDYAHDSVIPRTGTNITLVNDTRLSIEAATTFTQTTIGTDYDLLYHNFSQYSLNAVIGCSDSLTIHHEAWTEVKHWRQKWAKKFLWWTIEEWYEYWDEYIDHPAYDETFERGYKPYLIDGSNIQEYAGVAVDVNGSYKGGTYQDLGNNIRALYHGDTLYGLSTADDNSTIGTLLCSMSEIDSNNPITTYKNSTTNTTYVYYKDSRGWNIIKISPDQTLAKMKILNDIYILLNYDTYYNCFCMDDKKWYHYGSDWNDRTVFTCSVPNSTDLTSFVAYQAASDSYYFASAQSADYINLNTPFISTIFPPYASYLYKTNTGVNSAILAGGTPNGQDIDIYFGKTIDYGEAPIYRYSYDYSSGKGTKYTNSKLENTNFAFSFTLIPSIFAIFIKGFINQGIIVDNGHSYIQVYANNTKPVFAINFVSQLEGITGAFIIQGQYYVIINGAIYRYTNGAVEAIVAIDNMRFVGNTPYMALFWSETNKMFYRFTGDNQLYPIVQADEVSEIKNTAFNPNTLSIYIITDVNILIISQDTLIKLPYTEFDRCFPLVHGAAFAGNSSTLEISYNKRDGYSKIPIDLETELYGYGNSVKAVNDCVYLRLYDADRGLGKVTITSETLNEGGKVSNKKEFTITPDMWDKVSNTLFLRYQPGNQDATGFSVHIISPFAIATMQISSQPETIQNSKNNM